MLAGGHPFHSETIFGLVVSIRRDDAKPLPHTVPLGLRRVIETALEKDLRKRFQTALEMRTALGNESYGFRMRSKETVVVTEVPPAISDYVPTVITDYSRLETIFNEEIPPNVETALVAPTGVDGTQATGASGEKTFRLARRSNGEMEAVLLMRLNEPEVNPPGKSKRAYWAIGGVVGILLLAVAAALIAMTNGGFGTQPPPPANIPAATPQSELPQSSPTPKPAFREEIVKPVYTAPKKVERPLPARPKKKQDPNCVFTNTCK